MNDITIKSNNRPRNLIYGYELPLSARKEFDYINPDEFDMRDFLKYKGQYYDIHEFMTLHNTSAGNIHFKGWQGYISDSYFSGVLIKYVGNSCEQVIVASYYS